MSIKKRATSGFLPLMDCSCFEILLFTAGKARLNINGESFPAQEGGLAFITPFHLFQLDDVSDHPVEYYACRFDWAYLARKEESNIPYRDGVVDFLVGSPYVLTEGIHYNHIRRVFEKLVEEAERDDMYSSLLSLSYVQYLYSWFTKMSSRSAVSLSELSLDD